MKVAAIISFVYGVLLIMGGAMGYKMAGSMGSLISGGLGGVLILVAGYGFLKAQSWALPLGAIVTLGVLGFFGKGLVMPSPVVPKSGETMAQAEAKHAKAHTRQIGMTALSALVLMGMVATGRRKNS